MEKSDSLKPGNQVKVTIWGPEDSRLYEATSDGFHNIETAITTALDNANLGINAENCVFEVTNLDTGVSHKYRFNAHGNLKLIV